MKNSLFTIHPYRDGRAWVFDDETVDLVKEPFVAGADTFLDTLSEGHENITVVFSDSWFPDHQTAVRRLTPEEMSKRKISNISGTYYINEERDHLMWLCPALNKYYPVSPEMIYIKVMLP